MSPFPLAGKGLGMGVSALHLVISEMLRAGRFPPTVVHAHP